ncbi:hypothetical protein Tco_0484464 [Tanacetum coccineum]
MRRKPRFNLLLKSMIKVDLEEFDLKECSLPNHEQEQADNDDEGDVDVKPFRWIKYTGSVPSQDSREKANSSCQDQDKTSLSQQSTWGLRNSVIRNFPTPMSWKRLDQMVKTLSVLEYNKGVETRKWSEDDKRRSKDFIIAIEKRLQIRRIYRSLESLVGGRIRDIDYRLIK